MTIPNPRQLARSLFDRAIEAAEPAQAVRKSLLAAPLPAMPGGRLILIALGKAACSMMEEALKHVPQSVIPNAIAVTNYENARTLEGCEVIAAGHPVPDKNGQMAARRITEALKDAGPNDFVLALISGGGSALLPSPIAGITLNDKIETNEILLRNGYEINEINLIRQQLSTLKGGGLSRLATPAPVRSLIISDVIGDDLRAIASGPTTAPIGSAAQAAALLRSRGHFEMLPKDVQSHFLKDNSLPFDTPVPAQNQLICSNRYSLDAMCDAAKVWAPLVVSDHLQGNVKDAADEIASFVLGKQATAPQVLLWGGETTVNVTGSGRGGRNQELALR
ncbi:MAG: glycerate kinase type-2 family protein, partial [Paracoccaceae bacterium]